MSTLRRPLALFNDESGLIRPPQKQMGDSAHNGSRSKDHIQIAVKGPACNLSTQNASRNSESSDNDDWLATGKAIVLGVNGDVIRFIGEHL